MNRFLRTAGLTVCLMLLAAVDGALVSPAYGQEDQRHDGWREHKRHDGWQQRARDDGWREHEHHHDYRLRPDVYYSAPPVVVMPRGYYAQPGATLNLSFPFFR